MEIDLPPVIETKPVCQLEPPVAARKRSEPTTTNTAITAGIPATPTTNVCAVISFAHSEWQKQFQPSQAQETWVRGPYKKTIAREAPGIGPEGELSGASSGIGEFPVDSDWGKNALAQELRGMSGGLILPPNPLNLAF